MRLLRLGSHSPLRDSRFRLLWSAQLVSLIGDQLFPVALVGLALTDGGNAVTTISSIFAARFLALGLFIVVGGVIADRVNRLSGMLFLDLARGAAVVCMVLLGTHAHLALLAGLTFVLGAGEALFNPLYQALLPELVHKEALQRANSLSSVVRNLATVVGPALAAIIVAGTGARTSLTIDAVTFLFSAASACLLRRRYSPRVADDTALKPSPMWQSAWAGVRIVLRHRWLASLEGVALVHTLIAVGPWLVLLPIISAERNQGLTLYGLYLTSFGAGGVVGALAGGHIRARQRGTISLIGVGIFGVACLQLGWGTPSVLTAFVFAAAGFGTQMSDVVKTTAIQEAVQPDALGRVFSLDFFASFIGMPIGMAAVGALSGSVAPTTFMQFAGWFVIATSLLPLISPSVRTFRTQEAPVLLEVRPNAAPQGALAKTPEDH